MNSSGGELIMRAAVFGTLLATALSAIGCSGAANHAAATPTSARATSEAVAWRAWGDEAFAEAKRDGKIVLVDVGIEGCTACRWMYQETYRDAAVVKILKEKFVTIAVDADVQPDLGARFEEWGWPATIFMTPEREQVVALRGSRSPEVFAKILADVVKKKGEGSFRPEAEQASLTKPSALADVRADSTRLLDAQMNRENGGWTNEGPQYIQGPSIEVTFLRAAALGRTDLRDHALRTLEGYAKLIDSEWGGVFVAAHEPDFTGVIVEKRLVQEAEAMRSFALAYSATHDAKWKDRAYAIDRYVASFLLAPDGTFYSTQQDEAPGLPAGMSPSDYFRLPDKERRKYGVPPVDHAVYTDQNAQAIEAYAMLYEASGDERMLERATRAADAILATRLDPGGFIRQTAAAGAVTTDARKRAFAPRAVPYLTAQAQMAMALLALHRVTGEARWLESARGIVGATQRLLADEKGGGFFSSDARIEKPIYENVFFARALHGVGVYTHDASLDAAAERALIGAGARRGAFVALAVEELALGAVEISITGAPTDPAGRALHRAALAVHEPRKAVHWDTAHKYPDRGAPAAYVCTATSCSSPIRDPARIAAVVAGTYDHR